MKKFPVEIHIRDDETDELHNFWSSEVNEVEIEMPAKVWLDDSRPCLNIEVPGNSDPDRPVRIEEHEDGKLWIGI